MAKFHRPSDAEELDPFKGVRLVSTFELVLSLKDEISSLRNKLDTQERLLKIVIDLLEDNVYENL